MEPIAPIVDRLALLLEYPDRTFFRLLEECRAVEPEIEPFASGVSTMPLAALHELYTKTFDLNAGCTLDMGWHLFGERPERGAFLADLRSRLASARVDEGTELPDYLPQLLKLLVRLPPNDASRLHATLAPAVDRLVATLAANGSPYESLVKRAFAAARPYVQVGV
jgi:nitrate reductase molybdenum cofactor assembly chaperone